MNRIAEIRDILTGANCNPPAEDLDAILLTGPINRRWATGYHTSDGALVITKGESVFITDSRYIEGARARVQDAEVVQIGTRQTYPELVGQILTRNKVRRLGFEERVMTQGVYQTYQEKVSAELYPASTRLDVLRASKTAAEYAIMRRAQEITDQTFTQILELITPEITERALAAEIVYHLMKNGAQRPSFDPIVVSGERSSMPHGVPGDHKLQGFVTMDFGAVVDGYCADMTRTVAVGPVTDEMQKVYDTVLQAQETAIAAARAGIIGKDLDRIARDVITAAGYGDYFGHGLGHTIGLEVHESYRAAPIEERPLPVGAIVTIEPGIYLPGEFGVRIEDMLYLTEAGSENLTKSRKDLIRIS
ncbi:MAG: aminopeptidase P family protein [Oscillospiraceae bacterium]|nr:aminopeptidase P family protein [Oscillospiraceae bacterium]